MSCAGNGTAVGRGADRVHFSCDQGAQDWGTDESLGSTKAPRIWRGAVYRAVMASMIALDQYGDPSNNVDVRGGKTRANYCWGGNFWCLPRFAE